MAAFEFSTLRNDANLVSYWKGENVNDSEGSNTLTNNNTVGFAAGLFDNAFDFGNPNSNKYLSLASNVGIAGNGDLGVSMWVKLYAEPASNAVVPLFIHRSTTTADRYFSFYYFNNAGTKQLVLDNSNGFAGATKYNIDLGTTGWYHFVINRSGGVGNVFSNNSSIISGLSQGSNTAGTNDFRLANIGGGDYGNWLMDDVTFFNRDLEAADVSAIFNAVEVSGGNPMFFSGGGLTLG